MTRIRDAATRDLFPGVPRATGTRERLAQGAVLLHGFATEEAPVLMAALQEILAVAPLRNMETPGGYRMSVAMTNCGRAGWIADRNGYRYARADPATGRPWPPLPNSFHRLAGRAAAAAGYAAFAPDACLINRYEPGARLTLHQDRNERDFDEPIVSISLGLPAVFLFGGLRRRNRPRRIRLESGDVAVWGGQARLVFHGIEPLADGDDRLTGRCRINLTLRKAL